jgi:RHS repeat-associated protein
MKVRLRASMATDAPSVTARAARVLSLRRLLPALWTAVMLLVLAAPPAFAQSGSAPGAREAPAVREALARQLQAPGPSIVTQGGSGGSAGQSPPAGQLVPSLSSAYSDTWSSPGEPLVTRIYNTPVNYKGPDAQWHPIDNRLVASALGGYENAANSFSLRLPESLTSAVSVTNQGRSVSFALEGAAASLPSVSGSTASYAGVLPSTDLAYVSEAEGVREVATLRDANAPSKLRYALSLPAGITPHQQADGSIALSDAQGTTVFAIPAPVAFRPGQGAASGRRLPVAIVGAASSWTITVDTGEAWLRSELAGGPVAVDPTVTVSATQACTITAESPKTGACSSTTMQVGYDSTHQQHHGLLKFDVSSLPLAATVLNAKLGLYVEAHSTTSAKAVGVYRVTKPWTTAATWETYDGTNAWSTAGGDFANPENHSDVSLNSSVGAATGWYYWYPTRMVQEWLNTANAPTQEKFTEGYANEGLIVKDQTETGTQNLLTLASPTASANKPYLEIEYLKRGVGSEPQYTQLSTALTDKLTLSVNAASGNLKLTNQDLHIAGINGMDYASTRTFNEIDGEEHNFGRWRESMFIQRHEYPNGDVRVGNGTGALFVFQKQADNTYITPPGIKATYCTATVNKAPCPEKLPSESTGRLLYEDPEAHYVDFRLNGWALDMGNRYENKLAAGDTEGKNAITSWTDTRGHKINYELVSGGSFYSEIKDESGARHTSYSYETIEGHSQLTGYTDANGKATKYHYASGNLDQITDPQGNVIKLAYDAKHRIKEVTRTTNSEHTTGPTTRFVYFELGQAPSAYCTTSQIATIVRDADWEKHTGETETEERTFAKRPHETLYCANVLDEAEKTVDANGNESKVTYNPFGAAASSTAAAPGNGETGGTVSSFYGVAGVNLECVVQGTSPGPESCPSRPGGEALMTSYSYGDGKFKNSATKAENPQEHSTTACYTHGEQAGCTAAGAEEPAGALQTKTDALAEQNKLSFTYNTNGTVKTATDAGSHTTEYGYDEKGNLKEIKPPIPLKPTAISVDALGRPEVITDGAKHKATISYDKLDRTTKIEYTGTGTAKTVSYEYDANGNITKREDATGTVKYTVDALNRLTKEDLPGSVTHTYEFDPASNMTAFTDGGGTTTYKYDGLNEVESMTEPKSLGTDKFKYNGTHALTEIEYPSGVKEHYTLHPATGRPEKITAEKTTGATVPTLSYTYKNGTNNTAQIRTLTESPSGAATTYKYDNLERLSEAVTSEPNKTRYAYKLDGAGNRLEHTYNPTNNIGGETTYYVPNAANELECRQTFASTKECSKNTTTELSHYEHDEAGNLLAITPKHDTTGSTFAYNAASETSTLTPSGESALSLTYGGTGQDNLITKGSSTSIENSLLGLTREVTGENAACIERTPNGLIIDIRTPTASYNPLYDAQGDIIALVSSTGKVERTFHYGPYGENVKSEGTQTIPYLFGYKSGYRMPGGNKGETGVSNGLYHFGQRYYDPTTGRWTQQDPLLRIADPAEANRFTFVGDPINNQDPGGESKYGPGLPCEHTSEGCYFEPQGYENPTATQFNRWVMQEVISWPCKKAWSPLTSICKALVNPSETSKHE